MNDVFIAEVINTRSCRSDRETSIIRRLLLSSYLHVIFNEHKKVLKYIELGKISNHA